MFLNTGRNRENIGIENQVRRVKTDLIGQYRIRALADFDLALDRIRLTLLVKRHDNYRSTIGARQLGMFDEPQAEAASIDSLADAINNRFGHKLLSRARGMRRPD